VAERGSKESGRLRIHIRTGAETAGLRHLTAAAVLNLDIAPDGLAPFHRILANVDPSQHVVTATWAFRREQ